MKQEAPDPTELRALVDTLVYKPGWSAYLHDDLERDFATGADGATTTECIGRGMTLAITTLTADSYHPEVTDRRVVHYFIVPAATYDRRSWRRWLLDCYLKVEQHECCEFFRVDGERPYAPSHGPGNDPYLIREVGTSKDVATSFRGIQSESYRSIGTAPLEGETKSLRDRIRG